MHEAHVEQTKQGRLPTGEGWFILNLGEMPWETAPGFGAWRDFNWTKRSEDEPLIGVHIHVLRPGENFGYYHAEAAQEGFIVLSGECLTAFPYRLDTPIYDRGRWTRPRFSDRFRFSRSSSPRT